MALRRQLHSLGMRYRLHRAPVEGLRRKADIIFRGARVAVFVDGCFWHGCPEHGRRNHEVNSWYWPEKIARNQARDRATDAAFAQAGWQVVRVWEHDLLDDASALACAHSVAGAVRSASPPDGAAREAALGAQHLKRKEELRTEGRSPG